MESKKSKYENILKELAEIETSSQAAMQGISDEKKALAEEARQKQEAFDEELDRKTGEQIAGIRAEYARESDAEIEKIRTESEAAMTILREKYEKHMDARAEEIARGILAGESL